MIGLAMAAALLAAQEPDCGARRTQGDMLICSGEDYRRADRVMNAVWSSAVTRAQDFDRSGATGGEAERRLRAAQRAWIAFRDAQCRLQGTQALGGSLEATIVSACLSDLTERRTRELETTLLGR